MTSLFKLNKEEQVPSCAICVYSREVDGELRCVKKNRLTESFKKCRKFEVDIMSVGVKRKRSVEHENIDPEKYSIY